MNKLNFTEFGKILSKLGVNRAFYKALSENDNAKQQIYLGSSFNVLQEIPFGDIEEFPDNKEPNYKAKLDFWWISSSGEPVKAPGAQLILYTRYPEVRLSGFLGNCPAAPGKYLQPVPKNERSQNNRKDGRILIFGILPNNKVYAYLAIKGSTLAKSIISELHDENNRTLCDFPLTGITGDNKTILIQKLKEIVKKGWQKSIRLNSDGTEIEYKASNGGGYTLEALLRIIPNGKAEPDYLGWELKAFSGKRITLMTPEPNAGFYKEHGAKEFVLKYGHDAPDVIKYFTGTHKVNIKNHTSHMTLSIKGFDFKTGKIVNQSGGLYLCPDNGDNAAIWTFPELLKHWTKKHARACYVGYDVKKEIKSNFYKYKSPIFLGEGTEFSLFLKTMENGFIVYDPATKVIKGVGNNTRIKARSQFRINFDNLHYLYNIFTPVVL
jgi:hypothetical protein